MLRDFLGKLFPPYLLDYIPGQKIVVAAIATAAASLFGVDVTGTVDVLGVEVPSGALIYALAAYLWPSDGIRVA